MPAWKISQQPAAPPLAKIVSCFYLLSGTWTLATGAAGKAGLITLNAEAMRHLQSMPALEQALVVTAAAAEIIGAFALLRTHRNTFAAFGLALFANLLLTVARAVDYGLFSALGGAGIFATLMGWGFLAAVCVYTWRLTHLPTQQRSLCS